MAEEVGKLAVMSGKASSDSVQRVERVVTEAQEIIRKLSIESREKIVNGSVLPINAKSLLVMF